MWQQKEPAGQDRPTCQQHISELQPPVLHTPIGLTHAGVQIHRRAVNPIEAGQKFRDPAGLIRIRHLAKVAAYLLQRDDIRSTNSRDDAL